MIMLVSLSKLLFIQILKTDPFKNNLKFYKMSKTKILNVNHTPMQDCKICICSWSHRWYLQRVLLCDENF